MSATSKEGVLIDTMFSLPVLMVHLLAVTIRCVGFGQIERAFDV
jgi:hypothetical protein